MKHFHYTVRAYDEMNEKGWHINATVVELLDSGSVKKAITEAKSLVVRKIYEVSDIRECETCTRNKETHLLNKEEMELRSKQTKENIELIKGQRLTLYKQNEVLDKQNRQLGEDSEMEDD